MSLTREQFQEISSFHGRIIKLAWYAKVVRDALPSPCIEKILELTQSLKEDLGIFLDGEEND